MKSGIVVKNWLLFLLVIVLGLVAYQPSLDGDFVYDDNRQIEANQLIQNPKLFRQALLSDVWAFKADGEITVSNYWRPTFVAWMIINHQLFGLHAPHWRVLNVWLHLMVCVLLFLLLRSWQLGAGMALAITALFALHPVHVESVAWVAGAPDLLFSLFIMAALLCWQWVIKANTLDLKYGLLLCFALLFYALALGAKEVAIVFPPVFMLMAYWQGNLAIHKQQSIRPNNPNKKMATVGFLFVVVAVLYFVLRWHILGQVSKPNGAPLSLSHFIYSLPKVAVFYWQQLLLPTEAGANFAPRLSTTASINTFLIPILVSTVWLVMAFFISRKSRFQTLGLMLLLLPLLPALNLFAFHPEQLVHHRYLYFSVLGLLMLVIPAWYRSFGDKFPALNELLLVLLLAGFSYQSWQFSHIWKTNNTLWEHTVEIDPNSAFNWQQLANTQLDNQQLPEAMASFERSLAIQPTPRSLYGLAKALHASGDFPAATQTLQQAITEHRAAIDLYLGFQIYELYAVVLTDANQLAAAEQVLRNASKELPAYQALLADKLAVVLYLQNKKSAALALLLESQQSALRATHASAKMVFFRIGMLYAELEQVQPAKSSFDTFLTATQSIKDPVFEPYQKMAKDYINQH